ncbi:substrate-binding domain-containing protein [Leucobacter sp. HY1908]
MSSSPSTLAPRERPDAVFAANDLIAMGVLQALAMTGGLRVPDDIALLGYDDIEFTRAAVVPISSVRQPAMQIGATAVELLLREAAGAAGAGAGFGAIAQQQIEFVPELVVRASTAG